jgi:hypothetical protein
VQQFRDSLKSYPCESLFYPSNVWVYKHFYHLSEFLFSSKSQIKTTVRDAVLDTFGLISLSATEYFARTINYDKKLYIDKGRELVYYIHDNKDQ